MTTLENKTCVPCQGGVPPLTPLERDRLLAELGGGWQVIAGHHLSKTFSYEDFPAAILRVVRLAQLAEEQNHHPNISIEYNRVRLDIWTHKIDGLTESDFILAAKAEAVLR